MNAKALFGSVALLALGAGTATAGPCTGEIDNLTKLLASRDAGSGPTSGELAARIPLQPASTPRPQP
jgi:hypothetical protein